MGTDWCKKVVYNKGFRKNRTYERSQAKTSKSQLKLELHYYPITLF